MSERTPLLVLGLGNVLLEDDGVGAAAVALLRDRYVRARRCARARWRHAWPVAAAVSSKRPSASSSSTPSGRTRRRGPACAWTATTSGPRSPRASRRIRWASLTCSTGHDGSIVYPARVTLLGLVPESMDLAVGLSPGVRSALPASGRAHRRRGAQSSASSSHREDSRMRLALAGRHSSMSLVLPGCADVDRDLPPPYRGLEVPTAELASATARERGRELFLDALRVVSRRARRWPWRTQGRTGRAAS